MTLAVLDSPDAATVSLMARVQGGQWDVRGYNADQRPFAYSLGYERWANQASFIMRRAFEPVQGIVLEAEGLDHDLAMSNLGQALVSTSCEIGYATRDLQPQDYAVTEELALGLAGGLSVRLLCFLRQLKTAPDGAYYRPLVTSIQTSFQWGRDGHL